MPLSLRRPIFRVLVTASFACTAFAHDGPHKPPAKVADADAHRPTALPDRILLCWSSDPATTQAVTWRTDVSVSAAFAEINHFHNF